MGASQSDQPPADSDPVSRARAVAPTVEDRVAFIADLMAEGRYRTRLTVRMLAPIWGLANQTVANMAVEAGRMFRIPAEEREAKRAALAAWFEAQAHEASARMSMVTGLPDTAAALKAAELYGRYSGLEPTETDNAPPVAPTRVVVTFEEPDCNPTKSESSSTAPKAEPSGS